MSEEDDKLSSFKSVFSKTTKDTKSTAPTSNFSNSSSASTPLIDNIGKPLHVIHSDKFNELQKIHTSNSISTSPSNSFLSRRRRSEVIGSEELETELFKLNENLIGILNQMSENNNISKIAILICDLFDEFNFTVNSSIKLQTNLNLISIIRIFLQFYDNHLRFEVYKNSKNLLIKSFREFLKKLNFSMEFNTGNQPIPMINNFSINLDEINPSIKLKVESIISKLSDSNSFNISDQNGSFIAPIMRGFSKNTSIVSIMFGFPDPQPEFYDIINALSQSFNDIHFFIVKDSIKLCNSTTTGNNKGEEMFKPPFRIPNFEKPEISISISSENGVKSSGTLGCYIKPKLVNNKYKDFKFGLTCGHVLLNEDQNYPNVMIPSKVLANSYKEALKAERDVYEANSYEYCSYDKEYNKVDKLTKKFGQVIWGERTLINKKISDLAIIKIDKSFKIENFLGNEMDKFNTSLKFKNLYIKKLIETKDFNKHNKIFKIGSKTNYTTGEINGIKLIYWLDGNLQTSEFVISSPEPMFANSGDSGSILLNNLSNEPGLGAIGMLHSYDGELKQFGLFTPIEDIFTRLYQVTGVEWEFV